MMAAHSQPITLIDRLPKVRGRYTENAPLNKITWFRVGGPAEVMFRPQDARDLQVFLSGRPSDVPITVIGVGSNILVRDGGVPGVVVRLGRGFANIDIKEEDIFAGAAALDLNVSLAARNAGISGLEFLSGIPGTIGGALRMNAGCYGSEMKDVTVSAQALDRVGNIHELELKDLEFSYRHSGVPEDWIFTGARLRGKSSTPKEVDRRMIEIRSEREFTQPIRTPTGGSTFANPSDANSPDSHASAAKAWELIDRAGCRGLRRGGAMVSEKHCNFLINTGAATAADLEGLGEEIRRRVFEETGVTLEWEIRRLGVADPSLKGVEP
ncbi:MAG: UDP-N-acetylmuramate dehydrogenase [Rhodospirillales bacterium]|nr:UDP-N-acetylmuramate dehydrogenase [Rhodospirillales bacterium]